MVTNDSSKAISSATLGKNPVPCHTYDNWLVSAANKDADAQFASAVIDVARGTRVIASILCAHIVDINAIDGGSESTRLLLNASDTEALARLAVLSLDHLYQLSYDQVDRLNSKAEAGAKA